MLDSESDTDSYAVRRNQQALPRQMRFLEDDLKIFPEAFSAAGVQQQ